jgi:hypothetical protein
LAMPRRRREFSGGAVVGRLVGDAEKAEEPRGELFGRGTERGLIGREREGCREASEGVATPGAGPYRKYRHRERRCSKKRSNDRRRGNWIHLARRTDRPGNQHRGLDR